MSGESSTKSAFSVLKRASILSERGGERGRDGGGYHRRVLISGNFFEKWGVLKEMPLKKKKIEETLEDC
jgi:hypothetical protein